MTNEQRYNLLHPDTSAYAYDGSRVNPYAAYCGGGGQVVDNFNDWDVADFTGDNNDMIQDYISKQTSFTYDPGTPYDSILGLGKKRQLKKAEKKIAKAEKKLEQGNTKAATRKLAKGTAILNKLGVAQGKQLNAQDQLSDIRQTQEMIKQSSDNLSQPLSSQPMTEIGSGMNSTGGGGVPMGDTSGNVGVDSAAPNTAINPDDPTGWLAEEKELPNVSVIGHKKDNKNMALIMIGLVLLVIAIVYFAPKFLKKK